MNGITKHERAILIKWKYKFSSESAFDREIDHLIVIVHNPSHKHDSGYPFLRIFGSNKNILYDMGWHDHYLVDKGVNTDALAKNIWRVMKWSGNNKWKTTDSGIWSSTLWLKDGIWS